jgi:hypothetical protein
MYGTVRVMPNEVDEFDVDKNDLISCPDCGSFRRTGIAPVELESRMKTTKTRRRDDEEVTRRTSTTRQTI